MNTAKPDPEMLKELDLLLNMETLSDESEWENFEQLEDESEVENE